MAVKIVVTLEDGQSFESAQDFCTMLGIKAPALSKALSRGSTYQQYYDKIVAQRLKQQEKIAKVKALEDYFHTLLENGAKEVPNYSGIYATVDGKVYSRRMNRYLSQSLCGQGYYMRVGVVSDTGRHAEYTHRLVCAAFHGEQPEGLRMTVDHIDRDKLNNHKDNLRWCEQGENNRNRGNHSYWDWKGESLLLVQIAELEGWSERRVDYLKQRLYSNKETLEEALATLAAFEQTGWNKGSSLWMDVPALSVTGYVFPSVKAAALELDTCGKQLRKWLSRGFLYEEILQRKGYLK